MNAILNELGSLAGRTLFFMFVLLIMFFIAGCMAGNSVYRAERDVLKETMERAAQDLERDVDYWRAQYYKALTGQTKALNEVIDAQREVTERLRESLMGDVEFRQDQ